MASGIFAILDDVAALLDNAAALSKVAAKKTAGLLGGDLAVNAEKATDFHAARELPVIWAITNASHGGQLHCFARYGRSLWPGSSPRSHG